MILDFRAPELSDRRWASELLAASGFRGCLFTFGNNYVWSKVYNVQICRFKDFYLLKNTDHTNGQPRFFFPTGMGDVHEAIEILREYCAGLGVPLLMTANRQSVEWLREYYPEAKAEGDRDGFDYIYNSTDLAELKGKKYHSKRNHLNRFYENEWSFEPITPENIPDCISVLEQWVAANSAEPDPEKETEATVVLDSLNNFNALGYTGGLLRVEGVPQAFTFGEQCTEDTFVVHAEKALLNYQGAYTAVNCEFAKTLVPKYRYINREEDAGSPGLRKAKLSYHPAFLEEKYYVTFGGKK
ncbi:MAG: DUF2156 domain-containing protein [Oscillospiraceae bacterium]